MDAGTIPCRIPSEESIMSTIAVVGASGRTGRAVADRLAESGHHVIAVSRGAEPRPGVEARRADVRDPAALRDALRGAEAVVIALGISEHPLAVRLRGARDTSSDIRSRGTAGVIAAMEDLAIRRLVVLSSYGVGDSAAGLSLAMRAVLAGVLAPQIRDHGAQEAAVRASSLDWTIARPVNLVDGRSAPVVADDHMRTVSMSVGREQVAECLAHWATSRDDVHRTVALSS